MFFFEGFAIMFLTATPLAFFLVINRKEYRLPKYMLVLAMATLLSATFVLIGLISIFSSPIQY